MNRLRMHFMPGLRNGMPRGFALVSVLMLMALIGLLALGMLSLSTVTLRSTGQRGALQKARSNARMALMIAIGELQKEMGPDMRVSAKAALFDQNASSEAIDGVGQPNWLASYESWGSWLNASYKNPETGETLDIADTYTPKREKMFRRWLLSMPDGMSEDINAPMSPSGLDDDNSVILVGEGSLGALAASSPEQVTRAYLKAIGENGRNAWWISPENQKARIDMAKRTRNLTADNWETSNGDTAEVGVGALTGLASLDSDASLSAKLVTRRSLSAAGIDRAVVGKHFFDLTAASRGVLTSVRTGHLKKDLSLLFEKGKADLPEPYRFEAGDVREPSIRPMSLEIANQAVLYERHFAPWTRMRHFYRMYRQDSDALAPDEVNDTANEGGTAGSPGLSWDGSKPYTDCNIGTYTSNWEGEDSYTRFPILSHITYIFSLKTDATTTPGKHNLRYVASPIFVYWNPYNVEMRLPSATLSSRTYLEQCQPMKGRFYLNETLVTDDIMMRFNDEMAKVISDDGEDIVFNPGEFRIFSAKGETIEGTYLFPMPPGFDPQSFGGLPYTSGVSRNGGYLATEKPKMDITFGHRIYHMFNYQHGNTPASFVTYRFWSPTGEPHPRSSLRFNDHVDWLNTSQYYTQITPPNNPSPWVFDDALLPVGYMQLVLKGIHDHDYDTIAWERDWRCRNWIQAPPFYVGKGLYMSDDVTIGNTQRIDSAYEFRFGSLLGSGKDVDDIIQHIGRSAIKSSEERVTAVPSLELPSAPIGSLAGFAAMRTDPGWVELGILNPDWTKGFYPRGQGTDLTGRSLYLAQAKAMAYQSGVTGPGIGNSFLHPMIPRTDVYQFLNNSISMELKDKNDSNGEHTPTDTKAYCDYWDHVLLLNDALWDDYFVSSLADQTRPGASASASLSENLRKLVDGEELANTRFSPHLGGRSADEVEDELDATDGYLKAAAHLMVEGMFNVNSTSVSAWHALFAGIRERQVVYRDQNGTLKPVVIPSDKRIAISRFSVATTDQEGNDPEFGVTRDDGMQAWSGVRFLDDSQLRKLAEECVKQVKLRGPFLNFSEFINRRLSDDDLGTMGALQSAIDYDDASPESGSINYPFKSNSDYMLKDSDLGTHAFETPEAAVGSRFAGIPGYVVQSDLLKPIANTLSVRDDTFRIRAYGDTLDEEGNILARAWCEAVVQRVPEYSDDANASDVPARDMKVGADGKFTGEFSDIEDSDLTPSNLLFGRKFLIQGFRWLTVSEI
jgi:type II secretory pathway pseudopilin PulG